jgi:cytochrome c-type biogenesis protein CcmF
VPQAELGSACLLAALALAGFAGLVSALAGRRQDAILARVGRRAYYAAAVCAAGASAALVWALLGHDFEIAFVTEHSDRSMPGSLLVAAFYGGQEGSLLYWTLLLTGVGAVSLAAASRQGVQLTAYATAILAAVSGFFLVVLVFVASPFDVLPITPADGLGLNPVLRDGGMLIHPPFLLAGFSSFAVPFAFAMASLLAGRQDAGWIAATRRVALLAWGLQGVGLTLGMWWAYHVLGWGGYFGWDPVENVALMPWLATTAYIHSAQVQERRGQLKAWNFGLVILAFLLSVFGTFIVRSGVLPSVHTFALSPIGPWFFGFLAVAIVVSGGVLAWRAPQLRSDQPLESLVSREGAFLLQNLLLVALTAAILWGTVLPLLSGMLGDQLVVGAPYYERVAPPLFLALLALLAAGPLLPWRRAGRTWLRALRLPAAAALLTLALLLGLGARSAAALLTMPLLAAAAATSLLEYVRGGRFATRLAGPWPLAAARLAARNRRRYGAYLAHLGIVVVAAGIAGSHLWQQERTVSLQPGQSVSVAGHQLTYTGLVRRDLGDHSELVARLQMGTESLEPARALYASLGGQSLTRVAIRSTPLDDVYVVLAGTGPGDAATLQVFVNPLVTWIWAGAALLILGVLLGNLGGPRPELRRAASTVRVPAP